jgi:cobalt-precorrin 5A hydrolase/precorrin-3B C17-methyltransferase
LICPTAAAADLARRLAPALDAEITGRQGRVSAAPDVTPFAETTAAIVAAFRAGRPVLAVCAAGIVVRALAPHLADKRAEPPVLALAEDGSAVVPLLGGHRGANDLARRIAAISGGLAAVTTAGEVALGVALDDPPSGWRLADPGPAKPVAAGLLAGDGARVVVESGSGDWLAGLPAAPDGRWRITVSHRAGAVGDLLLRPPVLALGVGCERDAAPAALIAHVRRALADADLAPDAVALVASIDVKADEPAVHALAAALGVAARFWSAEELAREEPRLVTPSELVRREVGVAGVAEAAALAAVGPGGQLILPKRVGDRVTCAVALASGDIDPARVGRARGRLDVVGIGPGARDLRTAGMAAVLEAAEHVVGYGLYLDLIADLIGDRPTHATGLGDEIGRVDRALALAATGARVALVSSGDAGVYGLATLACERMAASADAAIGRVRLAVHPGLSAMFAAAARVGAPLGHDFAAISLSDLLTPWTAIAARVRAAAEGDFVVAFYNPRSERRTDQLARALAILAERRPPDTPVLLARAVARPDEELRVTRLADLDPSRVDMLTLVIVGASSTRAVARPDGPMVWTPRGYAAKATP